MALRLLPISLLTVLAFHVLFQKCKFDENSTFNIYIEYMDEKHLIIFHQIEHFFRKDFHRKSPPMGLDLLPKKEYRTLQYSRFQFRTIPLTIKHT